MEVQIPEGSVNSMFTQEDHQFIDFLFGKLTSLQDMEMIDLHDDDSTCDHIEFLKMKSLDVIKELWVPSLVVETICCITCQHK